MSAGLLLDCLEIWIGVYLSRTSFPLAIDGGKRHEGADQDGQVGQGQQEAPPIDVEHGDGGQLEECPGVGGGLALGTCRGRRRRGRVSDGRQR
jgi:hypothetical protein